MRQFGIGNMLAKAAPLVGVAWGLGLWLISSLSQAAAYATSWDQSQWSVKTSALSCELKHRIQGYGEAKLQRHAGGADQLIISSSKAAVQTGRFQVVGRAPSWRHDIDSIRLGQVETRADIRIAGTLLRSVLQQLEQNLHVDFMSESLSSAQVSPRYFVVSLTPRNFTKAYQDYLGCIAKMVPYSFAQVSKHTYRYLPDALDLPTSTKHHLDKMLRYSSVDQRVLGVIIDAHSDIQETPDLGDEQARLQADLVARYLEDRGFAGDKILSRVHGDKFPIASNSSAAGQAQNRRVTVRLEDEQLRTTRSQKVEAQRRLAVIEQKRTEHAEVVAQEEQKALEEQKASYEAAAKSAMSKPAGRDEPVVIRKTKPGISIEELQQMVEGQDLSKPRQPRIEIRTE